MDFKFPIVLENTGGEYAIVESITVLQLLSSGEYAHYTSDYEPYKPRIPTDSSVNVNITLPAHEARETMEFKIRVCYNDLRFKI